MTNYNEKLDEQLNYLMEYSYKCGRGDMPPSEDPPLIIARQAKQAIVEWHEIEKSEVYNSGCSDTARHILALFDNQIPEQLKQWLRLEIEDRGKL